VRPPCVVSHVCRGVPKCQNANFSGLGNHAQVHALSIMAKTPPQWVQSGEKSQTTPSCLGGHGH
jgi:hypothetical protein